MRAWIDAEAALARLGVKRATLYSYASRGQVRVRKVGGRRKQYFAADIEALAQRSVAHAGRVPRAAAALAWGEPVLSTRISAIDRDGPYYRTIPAVDLVDRSLPELASLLWQTPPRDWPATGAARAADVHALRRSIDALDLPDDPLDQAHALAAHARDAADLPDHPDFTAALALCVDHELNASTFTARVVASTGADLCACVVAALAAFSGPRHGVASLGLADLLQEFDRHGVSAVLNRADHGLPGFGHPLYPDGDPRGELLLDRVRSRGIARLDGLFELCGALMSHGLRPNLDAGLLAVCLAHDLPSERAPMIFAAGRTVGWIAHAFEQKQSPDLLRPRAHHRWDIDAPPP